MRLTESQLAQFHDEGYVFLPDWFDADEVRLMKAEVPAIFAQRRPENVREKTGDVVRTAFAVHTYSPVFRRLVQHPKFLEPAEQMLGGKSTSTSSRSTARPPSTATCGSGTRTTAPGPPTTTCPSPGP